MSYVLSVELTASFHLHVFRHLRTASMKDWRVYRLLPRSGQALSITPELMLTVKVVFVVFFRNPHTPSPPAAASPKEAAAAAIKVAPALTSNTGPRGYPCTCYMHTHVRASPSTFSSEHPSGTATTPLASGATAVPPREVGKSCIRTVGTKKGAKRKENRRSLLPNTF